MGGGKVRRHPPSPCGIIAFLLYAGMPWTVLACNAAVAAELDALPEDMRARLSRLTTIIEQSGIGGLPRESVRHLEGKLWELRMMGRDGSARAIYVTASGQRVVVVRAFIKKTQKTPVRELEIARQRAKDVS